MLTPLRRVAAALLFATPVGCAATATQGAAPAHKPESKPAVDARDESAGEGPMTIRSDGKVEFHLSRQPTADDLARLGQAMEKIAGMGLDERAKKLRRASFQLLKGDDLPVVVHACGRVAFDDSVTKSVYLQFPLLYEQYIVSAGAATLRRGGSGDDAVGIELDAILGTLRLYEAAVAANLDDARQPHLDELLQLRDRNELRPLVEKDHCQKK